jgi:hypothetical protein
MDLGTKRYFGESDEKARRRVNTSRRVANITAAEIERGVTIEALEAIGVPVYRYGTQITIHGNLPDVLEDRVLGYKCIFRNSNGTLGVRYVAVDGAKKEKILLAAGLVGKKTRMSPQLSSTGLSLIKRVAIETTAATVAEGRELLASVPECFNGSKHLTRNVFGHLYAEVEVNCIPEECVFGVIEWLTMGEIRDQAELDRLQAIADARRASELAAYRAEEEARKVKVAEANSAMIADWEAAGYKRYEGPKYDGLHIIKPSMRPTHNRIYCQIVYKKYGKKFQYCLVHTATRERAVLDGTEKWKKPDSCYKETTVGFLIK